MPSRDIATELQSDFVMILIAPGNGARDGVSERPAQGAYSGAGRAGPVRCCRRYAGTRGVCRGQAVSGMAALERSGEGNRWTRNAVVFQRRRPVRVLGAEFAGVHYAGRVEGGFEGAQGWAAGAEFPVEEVV